MAPQGRYTDIDPGSDEEEIAGLGDVAYWYDGLLRVGVGDIYFQIWTAYLYDSLDDPRRDSDRGHRRDVAIELAQHVAGRL